MDFPEISQLVVSAASVFAGATVLTTIGFGIGLTSVPLLSLVLDPVTVVVILNTVSVLLYILIISRGRHHLPLRAIMPVAIAGLVGVPVGIFILTVASTSLLRIITAVLVIVLTASLIFKISVPLPRSHVFFPIAGFLGGVSTVAIGIGGPLVVLFMLNRGWLSHTVRPSMAFYFLVITSLGIGGYAVTGLYTLERGILILTAIGPVILGFWLGAQIIRRISEQVFRNAVVGVIMLTSFIVLSREVFKL